LKESANAPLFKGTVQLGQELQSRCGQDAGEAIQDGASHNDTFGGMNLQTNHHHQDNTNRPSIASWRLGTRLVADGTFAPNETHNTSNNTREAEDTAMQRLLQRHHHTKACSTKLCSDIQEGKPCSQTTFCCYKQKMHRVLMGYASNAARKTMDGQKYRKTRRCHTISRL